MTLIKRIIANVLAVVLAFSSVQITPVNVYAAEYDASLEETEAEGGSEAAAEEAELTANDNIADVVKDGDELTEDKEETEEDGQNASEAFENSAEYVESKEKSDAAEIAEDIDNELSSLLNSYFDWFAHGTAGLSDEELLEVVSETVFQDIVRRYEGLSVKHITIEEADYEIVEYDSKSGTLLISVRETIDGQMAENQHVMTVSKGENGAGWYIESDTYDDTALSGISSSDLEILYYAFSTGYPNTWTNTGNQATDIANIALTQAGYRETAGDHTKYNNWFYGYDNPAAWCAIFISWCANQAGIPTSVVKKNARASGYSVSNMSSNPYGTPAYSFSSTGAKVGDIVFIDNTGNGVSNHVGLVYAVDSNWIYTVEGNYSEQVFKHKYSTGTGRSSYSNVYERILFYARPNYSGGGSTGGGNQIQPAIRRWLSNVEMGENIPDSARIQGGNYYACYELFDRNSGARINNLVAHNYTVLQEIYNPDGTLYRSYTHTNKDNEWLDFVASQSGTYTLRSTIKGTIGNMQCDNTFEDKINIIAKPITISVPKNNIYLTLGQYESETINVSYDGYYSGNLSYRYEQSNANVRLAWGNVSEKSCPLTFTANTEGNTVVTVSMIDSDTSAKLSSATIYVTVDSRKYTISYDAKGGTDAPSSQTKSHGSDLTLSDGVPKRFGYNFLGWSTSYGAAYADYKPGDSFSRNENTVLYAVWRTAPTVTMDAQSDSQYIGNVNISIAGTTEYIRILPRQSTAYALYSEGSDDTVGILYDVDGNQLGSNDDGKDGHNFKIEYSLLADTAYYLAVKLYRASLTSGNILIKADKQSYKVTFDSCGGSDIPVQTVQNSGKVVMPDNPAKEGYNFIGWYTDAECTSAWNFDTTVTRDLILYAKWEKIPVESITLDKEALDLLADETATLKADITPEGAAASPVAWVSSNEEVAKVENGVVTAVAVGECSITAAVGDKSAVCSVTVSAVPDYVASGECKEDGSNLKWGIDDDGKLTVRGTGEFAAKSNYSLERSPWYENRLLIKSAEIRVTGMTNALFMFYGCTNLTSVDMSNFDTSKVTNMAAMFRGCSSLASVDMSSCDTSQVTNMGSMFDSCSSLTNVDMSSCDTSQVTNMVYMFTGCSSLTSLDMSSCDTSQVTNMDSMFAGCSQLQTIQTPYNIKCPAALPGTSWYKAGGTKLTELPKNLTYSILIKKNEPPAVPALKAVKAKTDYVCGDAVDLNDLAVTYYDADGKAKRLASNEYTTNASSVNMSAAGKKTLTITYRSGTNVFTENIELTVTEKKPDEPIVSVQSIKLDKDTLSLLTGKTATLKADITPADAAASPVTWTSSNSAVAKVEDGVVIAVAEGECQITAAAGGKSAVCKVTVSNDNPSAIREYYVRNTDELMAAIGSYRRIILADGIYEIVEEYEKKDDGRWYHVPDTGILVLRDLVSVSIEAEHPGKAEILSKLDEEYATVNHDAGLDKPVVCIEGCKDVKLEGLILGHISRLANCVSGANVINLESSSNIDIRQCDLFGCGYTGISCKEVENVNVDKSVIRDCEWNILGGSGAKNLRFTDCILSGHMGWYSAVSCTGDISFANCKFLNNYNPTFDAFGNVSVDKDCVFYNNRWDGEKVEESGICLNGITWQIDVERDENNVTVQRVLKLGYPLNFKNGTINSADGTVLDYSDASKPWFRIKYDRIEYYNDSNIPVSNIPVESIKLNKDTMFLSVGKTGKLRADITPASAAASPVTWTSSDTKVAKVEDGIITAAAVGECIITAAAGGKSAVCKVTVTETPTEWEEPEGLSISFKNEQDKRSTYTGKKINPDIEVSYNGTVLTEGENYTVKYTNNINIGKAKVTVTGKGNFWSSKSEEFEIVQGDIGKAEIAGINNAGKFVIVSGSAFSPVVYYDGQKLTNKDYIISGALKIGEKVSDSDSGKAVTISGNGNYTGSRTFNLEVIKETDLSKFTVTLDDAKLSELTYDGKEKYIHNIDGALKVTGSDGNSDMKRGIDYMIIYPANVTDAGSKKFKVVGIGLYTGTVSKSYTIKPASGADGKIEVKYAGGSTENIKLPFTSTGVTFNDKLKITYVKNGTTLTLKEKKDYTVTYSGNKKVGNNAKFTVAFLGNYKGYPKQTHMFTIEKADLKDAYIIVADAVCKGKPGIYKSAPYIMEPGTNRLIKSSNYKVTYCTDKAGNIEMKGKNKVSAGDTVYVKIEEKSNSNYKCGTPIIRSYQVGNAVDLSKAKITFIDAETGGDTKKAEYTGNPITEREIQVVIDGKPADEDEDLVITYVNNIDKGKATVIVTGTGQKGCKYMGVKTATFDIAAYCLR